MKQYSLTGWFIILLIPFLSAQELSLLAPTEMRVPAPSFNPILEYVLANDTSGLCDLLAEGMNPNYILEDGQTALHYSKTSAIAAVLIDYGAEVNAKDNFHNTPLHHAVSDLNEELTSLLLKENAEANIQNKSYYTPLLQCLEETDQPSQRATIATLLLQHGANPNVRTQLYQNTPLYFAVQSKNLQAVNALLEHDAQLNSEQGEAGAPLDLASRLGDTLLISTLKQAGATHLRLREELLQAMYLNDEASISQLVGAGLDLNFIFGDIQLSPLQAGIKYMQSPTIVRLFLEKGALPDFRDTINGIPPLHLAVDTKSDLSIIQSLLEHEASLKAVDQQGQSLLHKAVKLENTKLISVLLEQGADPLFTVGEQSVLDLVKEIKSPALDSLFNEPALTEEE